MLRPSSLPVVLAQPYKRHASADQLKWKGTITKRREPSRTWAGTERRRRGIKTYQYFAD